MCRPASGSVQIRNSEVKKALGALDSRDSLRSSVAWLPAVLASSGFAESASPFQSARGQLIGRQKLARSASAYLNTAPTTAVFR